MLMNLPYILFYILNVTAHAQLPAIYLHSQEVSGMHDIHVMPELLC
jgi:hypothetical protein